MCAAAQYVRQCRGTVFVSRCCSANRWVHAVRRMVWLGGTAGRPKAITEESEDASLRTHIRRSVRSGRGTRQGLQVRLRAGQDAALLRRLAHCRGGIRADQAHRSRTCHSHRFACKATANWLLYGGSHKKKVFCHRLAAYHAVFDRGASGTWSPADPCHTAILKSMRQINRPLA